MSGRRVHQGKAASEVVPRCARAGAGASSSRHVPTDRHPLPRGESQHPMATYPRAGASEVPVQPDFPELEQRTLAYWNAHGTFNESVEHSGADGEFVFYDGPPFANGLPHYRHLLTGYVKDTVPRFRTMAGSKVDRRFGWDCHGLPAEVEAERLLGISGKDDILKMGIDAFNEAGRDSVLRYTKEWEEYVTRQARWVDFENDYKTLDLPYMESVMWAFKRLHEKGLIYQGSRCCPTAGGARPRCPTTSCGWTTTSTPTGPTRRSRSGSSSRPASGSWPGPPRRGRCPRTWPSRSASTSPTTSCGRRTASATSSPTTGWPATRRSWRGRSTSARSADESCSAAATGRCSTTWPTPTASEPPTPSASSRPTR